MLTVTMGATTLTVDTFSSSAIVALLPAVQHGTYRLKVVDSSGDCAELVAVVPAR